MQPQSNSNNFFGIKVSQPGINAMTASANQLLYTNDYTTETWYDLSGNQVLQVGNIATNNVPQYGLGVTTSSGSLLTFGQNNDGTSGMQITNGSGDTLFEFDGETWTWFDTSGNIVMYVGLLPVSQVYGWAVAVPGQSLQGVV